MSEAEKKKRQDYIRNRRTWIIIQSIIAIVLALDIILSLFTYYQLNKSHYVEYSENGTAEYYVILENDDFYDDSILEGGQSYVSELVKGMTVFFDYELNMDTQDVEYAYKYKVDALLEIRDQNNGLLISKPHNLIEEKTGTQSSNKRLEIDKSISLDYPEYNNFAKDFIATYDLKNTKASLDVRMQIDVTGNSKKFEESTENTYFISLNIPLAAQTFKIDTKTSIDSEDSKVLAYKDNANQNIFMGSAIISGLLELIVIIALVVFVFKSRNHDINYSIKVKRIVSAYKSYIQKIVNELDTTGYQPLYVETFREMLEIRDTIGAPILMNENEDKTRTRFFILTNTNILYMFEIKVENYDEIYGTGKNEKVAEKREPVVGIDIEETEEPVSPIIPKVILVENSVAENAVGTPIVEKAVKKNPPVLYEEIIEERIEEAAQAPDVEIPETEEETINKELPKEESSILAYLDNDGNQLDIRYSRSFEANLVQSEDVVKDYYSELKNYIMSFKGVKSRFSWKFETFNKGRNPFFKIKLRGKTILLYCAVDPNSIDKSKYRHEAIDNKLFADVPTLLKIKAGLNVRRAKEIIDLVMSNYQMEKNPKAQEVDYKSLYPYEKSQELIEKGLIKVLSNDEKFETK